MSKNRNVSKSKKIKPVSSKKIVKKKNKKAVKPVASKITKKRTVIRKIESPKKVDMKGVVVVGDKKQITVEQKEELEHLHRILSDAYVRQLLIEVGGESALEIVRHFYGSHSDEELAKRLELRISDVRATLNKLHSKGLVYYAREKDSETGWYSYSWSLNKDRIVKWVAECAGKGNGTGCENGNEYYICPTCGIGSIVGFEAASDKEFRCHRCNKSLEFIEEERFAAINQLMRKS